MRDELLSFLQRLLLLLEEGRVVATYKYALLLALSDLTLEKVDRTGDAPESVTTAEVARKVLDLYWPHALPFEGGRVLKQNTGKQAGILRKIAEYRDDWAQDPSIPLFWARSVNPKAYERLLTFIEKKLIEMPIPRLQRVGKDDIRFLYTYENRAVRFTPEARRYFPAVGSMLRPLIYRQWSAAVVRWNENLREIGALEDFLFGRSRIPTTALMPDLREMQKGVCFYCERTVAPGDAVIDHFIPWARYPDNGVANFVVADAKCNSKKRDYLACIDHLRRWRGRSAEKKSDLASIAITHKWDDGLERIDRVAMAVYTRLPEKFSLWKAGNDFERSDSEQIRRLFGIAA